MLLALPDLRNDSLNTAAITGEDCIAGIARRAWNVMIGHHSKGCHMAALLFCRLLAAFICVLLFTITACRKSMNASDGISVQQQIAPQPVLTGAATITIRITDATAKPVPHARIMVEADMTHPGMSPVFGPAQETAPGIYQAHINFNMRGDWIVLSHIKLANGQKLERQIDVKDVQAN